MTRKFFKLSGCSALALAIGISSFGTAHAQADDEIIVTATKREQTLQEVPVAVSVVGEQAIERAEIQDLRDLQSLVPSLQVNQLQSSTNTNFIIRGFGNGANNAGIEPSVGVFIDGVYRSRTASQISDLPNLQRVEVLRGPQSTLFGKNASAGVISVVTRKPQFDWGGAVNVTYGNFNTIRLGADVTGPISENVAFSLSGNYNSADGYARDIAQNSETNERNRFGLRGQILVEPTDDFSLRIIADHDEIDEVCCVAANLINGPTGNIVAGIVNGNPLDFTNALVPEDPFSYQVAGNLDSTNDLENSGLSMQADLETSFASLTSITAYRTTEVSTDQDSDFTGADLIQRNANTSSLDTFTQEIRITSNNPDSRLDWMLGGFYFDEEVASASDFEYGPDFRAYANALVGGAAVLAGVEAFAGVAPGTFGAPGQGDTTSFGQDNQSFSLFGTADFHISDRLTLTGGLNYTEDKKDTFGNITSTDVFSGLNLTQLGYNAILAQQLGGLGVDITNPASIGPFIAANPALYAALQAGSAAAAQNNAVNPFAPLRALQFRPPFLNFPNVVENGNSKDDNTSYTIRLAYDVTDSLNFYGSYATGFKATSWNLSRDSLPFPADFTPGAPIVDPVTGATVVARPSSPISDAGLAVNNLNSGTRLAGPETAKVFEIGMKAKFDSFAFNLTYFDQTIDGFQSNAFTGTGFALVNAGEQSTKGFEFDGTYRPIDDLLISFAGTYLDPIYDSFVGSAGGDITGTIPSGIPELSLSMGFNYDFEIGSMPSYIRADWQHTANTKFFDEVNPTAPGVVDNNALIAPGGYERGHDLINASAGVEFPHQVTLSVWARNLGNAQFVTTAFPSVAQGGSISGYPNQPRTYGITGRKKF